MKDRVKIQILLDEGAIRKTGEKSIRDTKYTANGIEETFELTAYGKEKYYTIQNAMEIDSEQFINPMFR